MLRTLLILFSITFSCLICGCSSNLVKTWDDDYQSLSGFKGGTFSYLNGGASFVIQARYDDGIDKVRTICATRPSSLKSLALRRREWVMV